MGVLRFFLTSVIILLTLVAIAQNDNSRVIVSDTSKFKPNPKVATILSAVVPGAGQVYNKKYWKVPLLYAGFVTFGYFIDYNNKTYIKYRDIYIQRVNEDPDLAEIYANVDSEIIRRQRDKWRRWRDMNVIGAGVLYFLQIIDANVDAHLYDYDIGDDLTLHCEPTFHKLVYHKSSNLRSNSLGVQISLKF